MQSTISYEITKTGAQISAFLLTHIQSTSFRLWYLYHKYFAFRSILMILHLSDMRRNVTRIVYNAQKNISTTTAFQLHACQTDRNIYISLKSRDLHSTWRPPTVCVVNSDEGTRCRTLWYKHIKNKNTFLNNYKYANYTVLLCLLMTITKQ